MSAWSAVLGLFESGTLSVSKVEVLINASAAVFHGIQTSGDASLGAIVRSFEAADPQAMPIIESIANVLVPGSGNAIALAAAVLAISHKMTPAEESAWMDRASQASG
jgi:hypothetical protein